MKRVVVTGATSMLGLALINECVKNGVEVLAICRRESKKKKKIPNSPLIKIIECDLSKLSEIKNADQDYDAFYHFAWGYTDRTTRDDARLQNQNIAYTLDAVELAKRLGCKKFIGAGSQAEYGPHDEIIDETSDIHPEVCYGIAKYAAGKMAKKMCDNLGMICVWMRIFSVFGTNDSENVMVSYALKQWKNKEQAYFSSGTQSWNYLYEVDAGRYSFLIGKKVNQSCEINVAGNENKQLRKYVEDIAEVLGNDFKYSFAKQNEEKVYGIAADTSRLIAMTEYTPQYSFREGIEEIRGNL